MPGWLRAALVRKLEAATIERAVTLIQSYLIPKALPDGTSEIDPAQGASKSERLRLLAWIGENPESELYDPLLFDALMGAQPKKLGAARDPNRPGRPLNVWRGQDILFALLLLGALATISWVNPPFQRVPATAEASPDENQAADNTTEVVDEPTANTADVGPTPQENAIATNASVENAAEPASGQSQAANVAGQATGGTSEQQRPPPPPVQTPQPQPVAFGPFIMFFDWDKDEVTPVAAAILDNAAAAWASAGNPSLRVLVAAHTDRSRAADYNVGLSQRMGNNVRSYLVGRGIPDGVITVEAFGESRPMVQTRDGVREPQNRRVEVTFGP
jgi:outer membrane protein OmpA-like peptidoglycan-associated protein